MPNGLASERPIFIGFLRFYHHIHSQGRTPLNSDFALPQRPKTVTPEDSDAPA
jgi:hypothetical protein